MNASTDKVLHEAIARNAAAVLSLPSAGMLRHCKTRFLCLQDAGFWMESAPEEQPLVDHLIAQAVPAGVSFKSNTTKIIFSTLLLRRQPGFQVNSQITVEALLLAFPSKISAVQRRAAYRVKVPGGADIGVRIWRIPDHWYLPDKPLAAAEVPVSLLDMSVGGMGLLAPPLPDGQPPRLVLDERLRVSIRCGEQEVICEGRVRHPQPLPGGGLRVGVQFKKLESGIEGRQSLARLTAIVGQLQRDEARRMRLGLAG